MKKAGIFILCGLLTAVLVGLAGTADARPQYKKGLTEKYKGSAIEGALKEAKCFACHYGKGKGSKKNRNDYGTALNKAGLTKEKYMEMKSDKEAFAKYIQEALEQVLKEKSQGGETFGELIEAGKLPGTTPEE